MKDVYTKVADRILPKFSEVCKKNKCKHPICKCGHCSRNYHIGRGGECTKINLDLSMCSCKELLTKKEKKLKLKKGNRVWVRIPVNATIKSVNKKYGYTLLLDEVKKNNEISQYYDDEEVDKI